MAENKTYLIIGKVLEADGTPRSGLEIRAFDQEVCSEIEIGSTQTDALGRFEITYMKEENAGSWKNGLDLIVRAYDSRDKAPLVSSPLIMNALPREVVKLVIGDQDYRGPAEFSVVKGRIELELKEMNLEDITPGCAMIMARKVNVEATRLAYYVKAKKLERITGIASETFYALFNHQKSMDLTGLISDDMDSVKQTMTRAIQDNIIKDTSNDRVEEIIKNLKKQKAMLAISEDPGLKKGSLTGLLNSAGFPIEIRNELMMAYVLNDKPIRVFWQELSDNPDIGSERVDKLRFTIQLAGITRNHLPMVEALLAREDIGEPHDLAMLDVNGWLEMIRREDIGIAEDIEGESEDERKLSYARTMAHIVEDAYPTKVLAQRMFQDNEFEHDYFQIYFEDNPEFCFNKETVTDYLANNENALTRIDEPEEFTRELMAMQRIYGMCPKYDKYEAFKVCWQNNLHSAHAVARMGEGTFITCYSQDLGGETIAQEIFQKAGQINSKTMIAAGNYGGSFNLPQIQMIPQGYVSNWETLFGSLDFCECRHCRSVLSPAAYLVDLLMFLDKSKAGAGNSGMEKLFQRRPDLGNIELTCENTNTPLPYIDLINEVLENSIVPIQYNNHYSTHYYGTLTYPVGDVPQTTGKAPELKANPEYIKEQAYEMLSKSFYPWNLPFNLWGEEAKVYLEHLGIPLHYLAKVFRKEEQNTDLEVALCYLGILRYEQRIIAGQEDGEFWVYFGLSSQADLTQLTAVPVFLKHTHLEYEELLQILKTNFVNPTKKEVSFAYDSCALEDATLTLSHDELSKLHRFYRLARKTDWTFSELDKVITALNPNELDEDFIVQCFHILRLQEQMTVSLDQLLSWWAPISTSGNEDEASLYEQLFLNKTVNNPHINAFELANLGSTGDTILNQNIAPIVLSGINLNADELALLVNKELPDDQLNLENLSHLYRISSFTKAFKITVTEYLSLKALTGLHPLSEVNPSLTVSPSETSGFLETFATLSESGFTIEEMDYLLRHVYPPTSSLPPLEADITIALEELRTDLKKLISEHTLEGDLKNESVRNNLNMVLGEDLTDSAMAVIDGTTTYSVIEQKTFIDDHFAIFIDPVDAKNKLVEPGTLTDIDDRFDYILKALLDYLIQNVIMKKLATKLNLETGLTEKLLKQHLFHPNDPNKKAIETFLAPAFINSDVDTAITIVQFPHQFKTFEQLHKISIIVNKLFVKSEHLDFVFNKGPVLGWLNPLQLPLDDQSPNASFDAALHLFQAYGVQHKVFGSTSMFKLLKVIDETNIDYNELMAKLTKITDWSKNDINFLTGQNGYGFTFPDDFKDERWLLKLREAFSMIRRIGVQADQLWSWNTFELYKSQAVAIKNATKAKYKNERWLEIAPPLRDVLREKQRDALLAHVVHANGFEDADDLYAHYLIDPEMSACAMSSRIKQAISSVQLFVQRILMGLENTPENNNKMAFPPGEIENWQWMKYYRIWEANRKVFLYPENWIEPELRQEKSEFFQEMEDQLLQGEINLENLDQAYLSYLEKLDDVSNLRINGVYQDEEQNILHVFGRTKDSPHTYYYRRWLCESHWTPWEKINLEIEGNHIVPVVFNGRLYLFWPRFTEAQSQKEKDPIQYWKIQMNYSEYKSDKWSSAKLSKKFVTLERQNEWYYSPELFKKRCFFYPKIKGDELYLHCGYYLDWIHDWDDDKSTYSDQFDSLDDQVANVPEIVNIVNMYFIIKQAFKLNDCNDELEVDFLSKAKRIGADNYPRPSDSIPEYSRFHGPISDIATNFKQTILYKPPLVLPEDLGEMPIDPSLKNQEIISHTVLDQVPEQFKIAYPHVYQNSVFFSQKPFFYQGKTRSYFIRPKNRVFFYPADSGTFQQGGIDLAMEKDNMHFEFMDMMNHFYWKQERNNDLEYIKDQPNPYFDVDLGESLAFKGFRAQTHYSKAQEKLVLDRNIEATTHMGEIGKSELGTTQSNMNAVEIEKVLSEKSTPGVLFKTPLVKKYYFSNFFHPFISDFIKIVKKEGIKGLLGPSLYNDGYLFIRQLREINYFQNTYLPTWRVDKKYPKDEIDFSFSGAYSTYNWELFFHAPLLIASRLSQNQKFEEAQKWYHFIFDPTENQGQVPHRFWKIKPFYEMAVKAQENINKLLQDGDEDLEKQIAAWQKNPFEPHEIAQLRIAAYMKTVVMKYIDNLVAWGDHLFRRDTIESINEAAQLYILAAQILGKRPVMTRQKNTSEMTFNDLLDQFDILSNQQIKIEESFPNSPCDCDGENSSGLSILSSILYFCVPHNKKLLSYWDTVADRLFKIRHCTNIEGIKRELPLFQPPIDPGLLVKAVAAGVDLSSVLNDLYAPLPHYRFQYNLQKAFEMCSEVRSLGAALLSALEKRDGEELAKLRSTHEVQLLKAGKDLKQKAIKEAQETLNATKLSKQLADIRLKDYQGRKKIIASEKSYLNRLKEANKEIKTASDMESLASILHAVPNISTGVTPSTTFGGSNLGSLTNAIAAWYRNKSQNESYYANRASSMGSYERRQEDWDLQKKLAKQELKQFDKQIASSEIRIAMAEKDFENHELQTENSREVDELMRDKYTNQQLYDWMITQISGLYFQCYQMAYDLAKGAERAFQHELAIEDSNFIQFGYWDNLKNGLLAGERLYQDLKSMEIAYTEQNKREYELTKHISLAMLDPGALLQLRETGECFIEIPEVLFDLDHPGQYMRRIKSMSMTIPCVTGPYTNVGCKLTLHKSRIRKNVTTDGGYACEGINDERFYHNPIGIQSIAISNGQNDAGMFELSFRDERYLPFEGAGVISTWKVEFPKEFRQFDYDTITDIVLHMNYTAREGGDVFKEGVNNYIKDGLNKMLDEFAQTNTGLLRMFSMKQEFGNSLHEFLYPPATQEDLDTTFNILAMHFPYFLRDRIMTIKSVQLLLKLKQGYTNTDVVGLEMTITKDNISDPQSLFSDQNGPFGGLPKADYGLSGDPQGEWKIQVSKSSIQSLPNALKVVENIDNNQYYRINPNAIEDVLLIINYTIV